MLDQRSLPMAGRTHAGRSAVTCHFKCDSACAHPVRNQSTAPTFAEIAARQLGRRQVLLGAGAIAAGVALTSVPDLGALPAAAAPKSRLPFTPIASIAADVDALTVPNGYRADHDPALG